MQQSVVPEHEREYTIFVGNPGTGKSTLLNALLGRAAFRSGKSYGTGLTQHLQLVQAGPKAYYGDTPGLDDIARRKEAAAEIETVLKRDGRYRLVFVVLLRAGRCVPSDAATIKLVLEAVEANVPFAIIINKLAKEEFDDLTAPPANPQDVLSDNQKAVLTGILSGTKRATQYFTMLQLDPALNGKDDVVPGGAVAQQVRALLDQVPFLLVRSEQVKEIDTMTMDELSESLGQTIDELKEQAAAREAAFAQQMASAEKEHQLQLAEHRRHTEEQVAAIEKRREQAEKEYAQKLEQLGKDNAQYQATLQQQKQDMERMQKEVTDLRNRPPPQPVYVPSGGGGCAIL